jgi:hypothetical protein
VVLFIGDNMLTALSVARDSSMISAHHRVVLLTAQLATNDSSQKLSLEWSPISDILDSDDNIRKELNGDDLKLKQVNV